jgi:hypothetical protein
MFAGISLFGALTAVALVAWPVLRGQTVCACDDGRPFTAQMVERIVSQDPDGIQLTDDFGGTRKRDSWGRTYGESHTVRIEGPRMQTKVTGDGRHFGHETKPQIHSTIWISDCHSGTDITLFPDLKIARIMKTKASYWKRKDGASLFEFLTSGPRPPNVIFADLGFKDVEAVLTHGYKETILGTEDDGEWKGRARNVTEAWVSDDLAVVILQILTNVERKVETRITLTDIKRQEPDSLLFEIPAGYKIDSPPEETYHSNSKSEPESYQRPLPNG